MFCGGITWRNPDTGLNAEKAGVGAEKAGVGAENENKKSRSWMKN